MQLAAKMRKRTPQLRCLFALPSPSVSIRAPFEIGAAARCCCRAPRTSEPRTARAGCWARLRWERGAGLPALLPLPPPALRPQMGPGVQEGCSGEHPALLLPQDWRAAFLVPGCARGLLELGDYCGSGFWSPSPRDDFKVMGGSFPGRGAATRVIPTSAWIWERC